MHLFFLISFFATANGSFLVSLYGTGLLATLLLFVVLKVSGR
jgi:hypothetical protein